MSIILGSRDNIYQDFQATNSFFLNSTTSSNILYLNYTDSSFSNATIIFKDNFEFGLLNHSISIYNKSNLFTVNNNSTDIFTNLNIYCNINIGNYIKTSNSTVYLQNNLELNFNNNINNSFKIKFSDTKDILKVYKDNVNFYSSNLYASNIYIDSNSILYTNFIDSPNNRPVVIRNMSFAENLRIFTNSVVESIKIDNLEIFGNLLDNLPINNNPFSNNTNFFGSWSNFMIDNNINISDINFSKPNILVKKVFYSSNSANIGGSNILEFYTINSSNVNKKIFSINNYGCINIGQSHNINIPLYINFTPLNSNIFEYRNNSNAFNNISIGSNGFLNIGSNFLSSNQLNIVKNNYYDGNNKELISLNNIYNNAGNIYNKTETIVIPFINDDFITDFKILLDTSIPTVNIYTITNNFIINNIASLISIYNDTDNTNSQYSKLFISSTNILIYPGNNTFNINPVISFDNPNITYIYIYPYSFDTQPLTNYNIITINNPIDNTINIFNIYKFTYNYTYTGFNTNNPTNLIRARYNSNTVFSVSANGNVGIGTNHTDLYNLYVSSNAKIQSIDCANILNYLTSNISFHNNSLNNINTLNALSINVSNININTLRSTSNFTNYLNVSNVDIANIVNISSNGLLNIYSSSSFGIQRSYYNNYILNANISSNLSAPNRNNGIVIYNNTVNLNPNLLLLGNALQSYPSISLSNINTNANILLNNNNNLEILHTNKSVFISDNINKYVSLYNNSITIFNDNQNNSKIYLGRKTGIYQDWISSISSSATNVSQPIINTFGLLNLRSFDDKPIINTAIDNNNTICIGIGIDMPPAPVENNSIYNCNLVLINYETTFTSNVNMNCNLYITGSILTPSDSNLKKNIIKIDDSIEKISKISGYTYERIDTGNLESGLLAQEVMNILPEVVEYNRTNSHYNISYGNMAGLFVESIKELNNKIQTLTDRISYLEKINNI